ncbi:MAG TPA: hypothetical protein VNL77_21745, partial [Roseiflexaceae bacterium]|nr:hypothetical protein [Roseiflexaceae bacterium]
MRRRIDTRPARAAWPVLAYVSLAAAMTWPQVARMDSALAGGADPLLHVWILAWDIHALGAAPLEVWSPPAFYPYPDALAFTDNHLALALLAAPLVWAGASPVLAYNALNLLSYALAGLAVYHLVRDILSAACPVLRAESQATQHAARSTQHALAAFIAGAAFAFCAFRMAHYPHLQLLQTAWLAWALLFMRRLLCSPAHSLTLHAGAKVGFREGEALPGSPPAVKERGGGQVRDALLLGLFAALQGVTALYYLPFTVLALGLYAALWAMGALWQRVRTGAPLPWRRAGLLLLSGALAAAIVAPLMLPYARVYRTLGIVRSPAEIDNWSAPLQAYLAADGSNRLYGALGGVFEPRGAENSLSPGLLVVALALAGVSLAIADRRPTTNDQRPTTNGQGRSWINTALMLLRFRRSPFVVRRSPFVVRRSSFVVRRSSFVVRRSPFVVRRSSFAGRPSSFIVRRSPVALRPPSDIVFWLLLALVAFVLSLGTGLRWERGDEPLPVPMPYALLYQHVPGLAALRVPARWGVLVSLAACVLAGIGAARLLPTQARRREGAKPLNLRAFASSCLRVSLPILILVERLSAPLPLVPSPPTADAPPVYAWLAAPEQRDIRVLLELPLGKTPRGAELDRIVRRQFYQTIHWKALPVSYSGVIPFGTTELMARIQRLPDDETLRYLRMVGVDTLVVHRAELEPGRLNELLAAFDATPLLRRRAEVGGATVYTLQPAADMPGPSVPGASIYVSADERMPGPPVMGLLRRWAAAGHALYGPGRLRYYAPLAQARPGQVFDFGLLAVDEDPLALGFHPGGLRWASNGLALYERDPQLRASMALGRPMAGRFHPEHPAALELTVEPTRLLAGGAEVRWERPAADPWLELDVASLEAQTLTAGGRSFDLQPGLAMVALPARPGEPLHVAGTP